MGPVVAIRHVAALKLVSAVAAAGALAACAEPEAEPLALPFEPGPATPIDIAVSDEAACLLLGDGRVVSWGSPSGGAVNPGSTYSERLPPAIVPLQHVVKIVPNFLSFCALTFEGRPYCWGDGFFGQLGDGYGQSHWEPWPVYGETFTEMWASKNGVGCGRRPPPGEELVCWGIEIGDGTQDATAIPTVVEGFPPFHIMSPPFLVDVDDALWCWGSNCGGTVGDPDAESRWVPAIVDGIPKVAQVVSGGNPVCAVTEASEVWCWGDNTYGGAGLGYASPVPEPVHLVPGLSGALGVAGGDGFACAWIQDGSLWCWGSNYEGSLGDGTDEDRLSAVEVRALSGVKKAATGLETVCAILEDDSVWCWGAGDGGILNRGSSREDSLVPIEIDWRSALEAAE